MDLHGRSRADSSERGDDLPVSLEDRLAGHIPPLGDRARRLRGMLAAPASAFPVGYEGRSALGVAAELRHGMLAAAANAAAEVRRRTRRTIAVILAAILSLGGAVLPATALIVGPGQLGGFEIDGNLTEDATVAGDVDWINAANVTVVADDTIDSAFQGSSKEEDPANWVCQSKAGGVTPGKDNILRAYVNTRISADEAYLDLAFVKQVGEGSTHVNFEFNQVSSVTNPPYTYAEGACPITRTVGDLLFTYDFGGTSDPTSTVRVWRWSGTAWIELDLPVDAAAATNNGAAVLDARNGGNLIPARAFGELTVDLTLIPGFEPTCPGFAEVNIRTRSSSAITSALQDKMPPTAVDLSTCGSVKLEKVDELGRPLAGAVFGLFQNDVQKQTCTSGADGVCAFPSVAPGTYQLKELSAPAGYAPSSEVRTVIVGFREAVDLTSAPFTNPLVVGSLEVVKTNDANGRPVAGIRFQLLDPTTGALATTRAGTPAVCTTNADGICSIAGLVPGSYVLHEDPSSVPATMTTVADQTVVVVGNTKTTVPVTDPVKPLAISLSKLVDGAKKATVHSGDPVTYTLVATNTGQVPIDVASLADVATIAGASSPVTLPAGCTALVAGTTFIPVGQSQPLCTYTANPTKDVDNTATIVGRDEFGRTTLPVSSSAEVDVISPAITLVKTVNGAEAVTVKPGAPLSYRIVVTNTGDTPLTITGFTDVEGTTPVDPAKLTDCPAVGDVLAAKASVTCTYTDTADTDVVDTATVSGVDVLGRRVDARDLATVDVLNPDLAITKTVNGEDEVTVHEGARLRYVVTIRNPGDTAVRITDFRDTVFIGSDAAGSTSVPGSCATFIGTLLARSGAPGDSISCTYDAVAGSEDRDNVAQVTAVEPVLGTVVGPEQDVARVDVIEPEILIDKTVVPTQAHQGDTVTYRLVISNPSDDTPVRLTALTDRVGDEPIREDMLTVCKLSTATVLAPGQTLAPCFYTDTARAGDTTNVATVRAVDELGGEVEDVDDAVLDVIRPAIVLDKKVSATTVHAGDSVTYTVSVTNTGDTPLTLTSLLDTVNGGPSSADLLRTCAATLKPAVALGLGETRTCAYVVKTGAIDLTNEAVVVAVDLIGGVKGTVTSKDDVKVDVTDPRITIVKTASAAVVAAGTPVTYDLVITNTGDTALTITALTDVANGRSVALSQECLDLVGDVLAAGASVTCDYVVVAGEVDIRNTATVVAEDPLDKTVTDDDPETVRVIEPEILVTKDADVARAHEGDTITYTVVITNTGNTPLRLTSLTDAVNGGTAADLLAACKLSTETVLQPGAKTPVCTYTAVAGRADVVNVVVVRAVDVDLQIGVTDDDDARVDVLNPAITIVKTGSVTSISGTSGPVTFTYLVTNTGDAVLTDVTVTDDILGSIGTIPRLAPGESATLTREAVVDQRAPVNVGTATGTDELGKKVVDTDDAEVTFVENEVLLRPLPPGLTPAPTGNVTPAPAPAPTPLVRTGISGARQIQVALVLLVLGGLAVLPERIRSRRREA